jgi:hypothetical protein
MLMADPHMSAPGASWEGRTDQGHDDGKRAAHGLFLGC